MSKENSGLDVWAKKGYIMVDGKLVKSESLVAKKVDKIEPFKSAIQYGAETKVKLGIDIFNKPTTIITSTFTRNYYCLPNGEHIEIKYSFPISPCPAPRMTQSDQWKTDPYHSDPSKRQRKPVVKYFTFRDKLVSLCRENGYKLTGKLNILFIIPMPKSWSKKKQLEMYNQPHQIRPDRDNYLKAFQDAFDGDDGFVWDGRTIKLWGVPGETGEIIIF